MLINNSNFLQKVILAIAEEKYKDDVVATHMEELWIGKGLTWETKEDWISDYIIDMFNEVKRKILDPTNIKTDSQLLTVSNTFAMRLYSMNVGEVIDITNFTSIMRMPGGWLYRIQHKQSIFIPYNDEFDFNAGPLKKEFDALTEEEKQYVVSS